MPEPLESTLTPSFSRFAGFWRDTKLRYRGHRSTSQPIVIVDIDSASLEQLGRWPWRRDYIAQLIERVFEEGAKVVGLDIVFPEAQESVPEELREILQQQKLGDLLQVFDFDRQLAKVFEKYRGRLVASWMSNNVCRPGLLKEEECPISHPDAIASIPKDFSRFALNDVEYAAGFDPARTPLRSAITPIANIPVLSKAVDHAGFVNKVFDVDGLTRHVNPVMPMNGKVYTSLPLQMAQVIREDSVRLRLSSRGTVSELSWRKTGESIPTSPQGVWEIGFLGPERHFKYVSARELFAGEERGLASENGSVFKDAYVLVGVSALAVGDVVATPFEPVHPGVEVHATVLENLLSNSLIDTGGRWSVIFALLGWMMGVGLLCMYVGQKWEAVPAMVFALAVAALSVFLDFNVLFSRNYDFQTGFWYLQFLGSLAITYAGRYIVEQNDKKFVRSAFSKYVAPAVVDSIIKDPKRLSLGGRRENLTILFSDVRGFTTLSEKLDARTISEFLNDFLGMQTEIVFQHGGTLDKYIGDAVMAFWGAPLPLEEHALRACQSALAIAKALEDNRAKYFEKYGIHVHMGIGVHTGEVSVGNMGSARSFSYTVIGDSVNLASRLEGATKAFGVEILTTRATLDAIEAAGGTVPEHRYLAQTKVKGKKKAVEIIELVRKPFAPEVKASFDEAVSLYFKKDFKTALTKFRELETSLESNGKPDTTCQRYIETCESLLKSTLPEDWDGSWSLTDK